MGGTRFIETSTRLIRSALATTIEEMTVEQEDTKEVAAAAVVDVAAAAADIKDEAVAVVEEGIINTPLIKIKDNNNMVDINKTTTTTTRVGISTNNMVS